MANSLVLGLMNDRGCTAEQAKKIFRLVRDSGYTLDLAFRYVMTPESIPKVSSKPIEVQDEPIVSVQEDAPTPPEVAEEKPKAKLKKSKPKKKSKGKKK